MGQRPCRGEGGWRVRGVGRLGLRLWRRGRRSLGPWKGAERGSLAVVGVGLPQRQGKPSAALGLQRRASASRACGGRLRDWARPVRGVAQGQQLSGRGPALVLVQGQSPRWTAQRPALGRCCAPARARAQSQWSEELRAPSTGRSPAPLLARSRADPSRAGFAPRAASRWRGGCLGHGWEHGRQRSAAMRSRGLAHDGTRQLLR